KKAPHLLPDIFRDKSSFSNFSWWHVVPGLCGVTIIAGISLGIGRIGALKVFVGMIGAQLLGSLIWDAWIEQTPVTLTRVVGSVLALLGAVMVSLK
ncbi:MAG: DMT family transporter, partial [Bdellovibrionota bacterium]